MSLPIFIGHPIRVAGPACASEFPRMEYIGSEDEQQQSIGVSVTIGFVDNDECRQGKERGQERKEKDGERRKRRNIRSEKSLEKIVDSRRKGVNFDY